MGFEGNTLKVELWNGWNCCSLLNIKKAQVLFKHQTEMCFFLDEIYFDQVWIVKTLDVQRAHEPDVFHRINISSPKLSKLATFVARTGEIGSWIQRLTTVHLVKALSIDVTWRFSVKKWHLQIWKKTPSYKLQFLCKKRPALVPPYTRRYITWDVTMNDFSCIRLIYVLSSALEDIWFIHFVFSKVYFSGTISLRQLAPKPLVCRVQPVEIFLW